MLYAPVYVYVYVVCPCVTYKTLHKTSYKIIKLQHKMKVGYGGTFQNFDNFFF